MQKEMPQSPLNDEQVLVRIARLEQTDRALKSLSKICFFPVSRLFKAVRPVKETNGDGMAWFVNLLFGGPALIITVGAIGLAAGVVGGITSLVVGGIAPLAGGMAAGAAVCAIAGSSITSGSFLSLARLPVWGVSGFYTSVLKGRGLEVKTFDKAPYVVVSRSSTASAKAPSSSTASAAPASDSFNQKADAAAAEKNSKPANKPDNNKPGF